MAEETRLSRHGYFKQGTPPPPLQNGQEMRCDASGNYEIRKLMKAREIPSFDDKQVTKHCGLSEGGLSSVIAPKSYLAHRSYFVGLSDHMRGNPFRMKPERLRLS